MSKTISVASAIEKSRLESDTPFLVCLDIAVIDPATRTLVETLRVTRNDEDIIYRGNTYIALNFDLSIKHEAGAQPTVTLSIHDLSRAVQARMQAYGGGVGFRVAVFIINAAQLEEPPEAVEHFEVMAASAANYTVSWTLGVENMVMIRFPRRLQMRGRCGWRYKSRECGYKGSSPSCDLTLHGANGCERHANVKNYGGFPAINLNIR